MKGRVSMVAKIIDGRLMAKQLNSQTKKRVNQLQRQYNITPGIAVVLIGDDPASIIYTRNKNKKAGQLGIYSIMKKYPKSIGQDEVLKEIAKLNVDPLIHGILIQLPLPKQLDETKIVQAINPEKDVDGFHPVNVGKLYGNEEGKYPIPCTPRGIMTMLKNEEIDLTGKNAVIMGRSNLVGKPMLSLLTNANATVTMLNHHTKNPEFYTKNADILVVGVGSPEMIKAKDLKTGAVVIDVGINKTADGKLVGDVDYDDASRVASAITPVPGGVGPMTIATLMEQTVDLAEWSI